MDKGIDEVVTSVLHDFYKNADDARKNELKIELRYSLSKIANRVDSGFNIEVLVEPPSQPDAESESDSQDELKYAEMIEAAAPALQFLKREGKPILSLPERRPTKDDKKKE